MGVFVRGSRQSSSGNPFQMEGPTIENAEVPRKKQIYVNQKPSETDQQMDNNNFTLVPKIQPKKIFFQKRSSSKKISKRLISKI